MIPATVQLSIARTQAEKMLVSSAIHSISTKTIDSSGSETEAFVAQGTALPCLVYIAKNNNSLGELAHVGDTYAKVGTHTIRFKYNAGVTVGDKVVVDGKTFNIISDGDSDSNKILLIVGALRVG